MTIADPSADCHRLLVHLAGRIPQAVLVMLHEWLDAGELALALSTVRETLVSKQIPVTSVERELFARLLFEAGESHAEIYALPAVVIAEVPDEAEEEDLEEPEPVPVPVVEPLDLPFVFYPGDEVDPADDFVVASVLGFAGVGRVLRTWRAPGGDDRDPLAPARVYLVATEPEVDAGAVSARVGEVLRRVGVAHSLVEVFVAGVALSDYQRDALAAAQRLWDVSEHVGFRHARSFDGAVRGVPFFRPGHEIVDDLELRQRVVGYLRSGAAVLATDVVDTDRVEPGAGQVVGMTFRTDGEWIWDDSLTYYLERYGLAPEPALLAHIQGRGCRFVRPTAERVVAALRTLYADAVDDSGE